MTEETTTQRLMRIVREYRATHPPDLTPLPTLDPIVPPRMVRVWPYERDLRAGAHVASQSDEMRRAQVPLTYKAPRGD